MLTTLVAQPICAKIGRTSAGSGGGSGLLQHVDVLGRQREVVWDDDVCLSEQCRSLQIVGATSTEVASYRRHWSHSPFTRKSDVSALAPAAVQGC